LRDARPIGAGLVSRPFFVRHKSFVYMANGWIRCG
jgi:hypothetical protein